MLGVWVLRGGLFVGGAALTRRVGWVVGRGFGAFRSPAGLRGWLSGSPAPAHKYGPQPVRARRQPIGPTLSKNSLAAGRLCEGRSRFRSAAAPNGSSFSNSKSRTEKKPSRPSPPCQGLGTANTAMVAHAGRLLALNEGDLPYALRWVWVWVWLGLRLGWGWGWGCKLGPSQTRRCAPPRASIHGSETAPRPPRPWR